MEVVLSSTKPNSTSSAYPLTLPFESVPALNRDHLKRNSRVVAGYFADIWSGSLQIPGYRPQSVAIKVLNEVDMRASKTREDRAERLNKRVNRESGTWSAMVHHNILPILGVCYGTQPWIVTPWCQNGNLENFIQARPELQFRQRLRLVLCIARALQYLHTFDPVICHGDIKPRNVLISDDENDTFLCDFGLAQGFEKIDAENQTSSSGRPQGTARFSSPEQIRPGTRSPAGDVYSFALLTLNVLTGSPPFLQYPTESDGKIRVLRTREPAIIPNPAFYPSLLANDPLWSLMQRCWSEDPQERPSITVVLGELQARFESL